MTTLRPLYARLQKLLVAEETAKAQRARQFPKSSQGWRHMDTRDAKLKVAKFLLMDKKQQDEMMSREPVWRDSTADVDRVVLEYKSNVRRRSGFLPSQLLIELGLDCLCSRGQNFCKGKPDNRSSKEASIGFHAKAGEGELHFTFFPRPLHDYHRIMENYGSHPCTDHLYIGES
jgi:hypothetical protein